MKFGLKKKSAAAGGEKKAKRKSSRGSGDGLGKMKVWLAEHIEKLLLAAMAVVALFLVYMGFSKESLETDPDRVSAAITSAENSISSPTWTQVKQDRQPEPDRFDQQATQDTKTVELDAYAIRNPLHPRMQEQSKKRSDPALLAPFDLEVLSGYGAVAIRSTGSEGGIMDMVDRNSQDLRSIPSDFSGGRSEIQLGGTYESRFFVVITGLVPYKQQFDLYQDAFKGAAEYDVERDVPRYMGLEIERAEVQADGSLSDWQPLDTRTGMLREPTLWDSRAEELASDEYILPGVTMPLPPLVLRDVSQWARHSSVPLVDPENMGTGERGRGQEEVIEQEPGELKWGMDRGAMRSEGRSRPARGSEDRSLRDEGSTFEEAAPLLSVENGMLRYFDFTAEPGKTYQYRVQALLDDPNNPSEGNVPEISSCETEVIVRRQAATEPFRRTPWSDSTHNVSVPNGGRVLASTADAPSTIGVGPGRRVRIERKATDEPTIKLLALTWQSSGPYDVPIVIDAARGALLNGRVAEVEAIDPSAGRIRKLTDFQYVTNAMVLDVYGGNPLGDDLVSPGFALIRNADGRLEFRSELNDFDDVAANTIPPDEEADIRAESSERFEEATSEERGDDDRRGARGNRRNNNRRSNVGR